MNEGDVRAKLRTLPAVSAVLARPAIASLVAAHGHDRVVAVVREVLEEARREVVDGRDAAIDDATIAARVERFARPSLRRVVNATGVLVHTNLGRAPLAREALDAVAEVARGYSTLEFDLERGDRGERHGHAVRLLRELTGAEDALVANNNAAAMMLVLSALATGREVIVSRGELVEIGGGFRVPDVLRQSGATLVEVGTTNRTHRADYEAAIGERTALLLKVHPSNFAIVGFTAEVPLDALAEIGRSRRVPVVYDAGAGSLDERLFGEATIPSALRQGADLVAFSGDKLLGGPQAGIVVGRADLVAAARKHPLMRAVRPDKTCIAALVATLELWRTRPAAIPLVAMLTADLAALEARASALAQAVASERASVRPSVAKTGGGSSPTREIESRAVVVTTERPDALSAALRRADPPIVARIEEDRVVLDVRTIDPADDAHVASALRAAIEATDG